MIIVIIGLLCIKSTSAAYGASFSTILRTTRNSSLDAIIPEVETSGAEPLSKRLGGIRLVLQSKDHRSGGTTKGKAAFCMVHPRLNDIKSVQKDSPAESLLK
jgi:hypothetical protein